jgi:hypothetical protein
LRVPRDSLADVCMNTPDIRGRRYAARYTTVDSQCSPEIAASINRWHILGTSTPASGLRSASWKVVGCVVTSEYHFHVSVEVLFPESFDRSEIRSPKSVVPQKSKIA